MKETDWRNTLEVIVKGLVAVVVALAGLWILGWVLSFLGGILLGLAGIVVALLRWLVPVALIVGIVYFAVTQLQPKRIETAKSASKPEETENIKPEASSEAAEPVASSQPKADSSHEDNLEPNEKKTIPEA
jgi:uncharacterized membrane protein